MAKNAFRSTVFQSRIKKIMQSDEDVGKVAAASTSLVGKIIYVLQLSVPNDQQWSTIKKNNNNKLQHKL